MNFDPIEIREASQQVAVALAGVPGAVARRMLARLILAVFTQNAARHATACGDPVTADLIERYVTEQLSALAIEAHDVLVNTSERAATIPIPDNWPRPGRA